MMKQILPLTALAILSTLSFSANSSVINSASDIALTGATIENFNSVASGDYAALSLLGVSIVGNGGAMSVDSNWTSQYGKTGQSLNNSNGTPASFDIIFDSAVDAFGIWGGAYNDNWTFTAFDTLDQIIEVADITTQKGEAIFYGLANAGMSKVTLSGFGDWVIFDDLTYKASASVPGPAGIALLGLGLVGFGFSRKKKA